MPRLSIKNDKSTSTDVWLTPPYIIEALGEFDLDPCYEKSSPFKTANKTYTVDQDGLSHKWEGRVWLNPPYTTDIQRKFMHKMSKHRNGIALLFARTDTAIFQNEVFKNAHALFFIKGRVHFYRVDGKEARSNGGAPSVLIAYGQYNATVLKNCKLKGIYVPLVRRYQKKKESQIEKFDL